MLSRAAGVEPARLARIEGRVWCPGRSARRSAKAPHPHGKDQAGAHDRGSRACDSSQGYEPLTRTGRSSIYVGISCFWCI